MFFYLCKVLFSGFLQLNSNFVDTRNYSKYRDWAPLNYRVVALNCPANISVTSICNILKLYDKVRLETKFVRIREYKIRLLNNHNELLLITYLIFGTQLIVTGG